MQPPFLKIFATVKIGAESLFLKKLILFFFFSIYTLRAADETNASIALEYAHDLSTRCPEAAIVSGLDGYDDTIGFVQLNQDKIDLSFHKKWVDRLDKKLALLNTPELNDHESFHDLSLKHHLQWVELSNLRNKCAAQVTFLEQAANYGLLMVPNPCFQGLIDDFDPITFVLFQFLMAQKRGLGKAKKRLILYLSGNEENKPFITGIQSYLTQKIKTLQSNDHSLIYPSASRIYTIISRIKSFRKYSACLLNDPIPSPITLKFWHQTTAYIKFLQESILPFSPQHIIPIPLPLYEAYLRLHGIEGNLHDLRRQAYEDYTHANEQVTELVYEYADCHHIQGDNITLILNQMKEEQQAHSLEEEATILKKTKQSIRSLIKVHNLFPHFPRRLKFVKTTFEDGLVMPGSRCLFPKVFTDTPHLPDIIVDENGHDYDNLMSAFSFTAHVAWPGHALQFHCTPRALLRTSLVFNLSTAEGWASYAPHSLLPFCETLEQKISLWTARRHLCEQTVLYLDLMIGTDSKEIFKEHLMTDFKMDGTEAAVFIESYYEQLFSLHEIELVACYQGQKKLSDFREALKEKMGSRFKLKRFHKAVLDSGFISFDLSFPLIDRYFTEQ